MLLIIDNLVVLSLGLGALIFQLADTISSVLRSVCWDSNTRWFFFPSVTLICCWFVLGGWTLDSELRLDNVVDHW